ncbi:MAG TPA: adenylate/guanylate cyclase domain-containing protein [Actinomycetota bacterium]
MHPETRYARNGDVSLAYQVVGDGPRDLLLVFGFLSNIEFAWMYPSLASFLTRLASFSRLILMDRRGSGLSDRFEDAPPAETMLRDLEVVLDEVGSPKTTLFGLWDGAVTSVLFAATHPERVSSLVLFTVSAAQKPADDYPWAWDEAYWEEWLASIRDGWGTRAWVVKNARWMGPSMLDDQNELERWISYTRLAASPASAEAVMRVSSESDIREILPIIRTPALILHRVGDLIEPIEAARYVSARMQNARLVELSGDDGIPWLGDVGSVISEIEAFMGEGQGTVDAGRRLATVLFTDIVGSTAHLASQGDVAWTKKMAEHDVISRREVAVHAGRYVDSTGDGLLAVFDGPATAVRCAQAISQAIRPLGLEIRAGVHTGELESDGARVRGIAVHIGARVMSLAGPSEILASSTVKDLTAGSGLRFESAGEHELKGVPEPLHLYRVIR